MVAEMKSYMLVVFWPNSVTDVTITRKIKETIRAYSIAVAPR